VPDRPRVGGVRGVEQGCGAFEVEGIEEPSVLIAGTG
jgi:hypothetical protein